MARIIRISKIKCHFCHRFSRRNVIIFYGNNAISPQDSQRGGSSVQDIPRTPNDAADEEVGRYLPIWLTGARWVDGNDNADKAGTNQSKLISMIFFSSNCAENHGSMIKLLSHMLQ